MPQFQHLPHEALAVCAALSLLLSGCATTGDFGIGPEKSLSPDARFHTSGVTALAYPHTFEIPELLTILDPASVRGVTTEAPSSTQPAQCPKTGEGISQEQQLCVVRAQLAAAFHAFYQPANNKFGTPLERRDRAQDRLIAASNQRCGDYKIYLRRFESYSDTSFGLGATIAGAIGSVTRHMPTGQAWSALSALSSGAGATVKQGVFANLASYIIIPGIDLARHELLAEIEQKRALDVSHYTVERALADAARYNSACTIEVGLERAKQSIQTDEDPGINAMNRVLGKLSISQDALALLQKSRTTTGLTADELTKARTYAGLVSATTPTVPPGVTVKPAEARASAASLRDGIAAANTHTKAAVAAHKALLDTIKECADPNKTGCTDAARAEGQLATTLLTALATPLYGDDSVFVKGNQALDTALLEVDKRTLTRLQAILTWRTWQYQAADAQVATVKQLVDVCETKLNTEMAVGSAAFLKEYQAASLALTSLLPNITPLTTKAADVKTVVDKLATLKPSVPTEKSAGCDEALAVFKPQAIAGK